MTTRDRLLQLMLTRPDLSTAKSMMFVSTVEGRDERINYMSIPEPIMKRVCMCA
jgi:hypothetical protein